MSATGVQPSLGIVIPVGPGDRSWRSLLGVLDQLAPELPRRLVYARGDQQARPRQERWTDAGRGRARQQNAGVAGLDCDWVWLLHADSRPVAATLTALRAFVSEPGARLGYFDLRFYDGPALMRITEAGVRWRCRWLGVPFGDQGFVLPRQTFFELGAFDEQRAYGEDHALVWQARRMGVPVQRLAAPLYTSARKYREQGWLRTTWQHQRLTWQQAVREARLP
ncbi:MAG: glycosyl transferase family 2 [Lysobacterales bacterium]